MVQGVTFTSGNGGVGKTTMALNVSDALGRDGYNVLCIDFSPQYGGLTDIAGFTELLHSEEHDVMDILLSRERGLREILLDGDEYGMSFDLVPANMSIEDFSQIVTQSNISGNKWTLLYWEITEAKFRKEYDVIVIDAEAGRDLAVRNAIIATGNVILPTENNRRGRRSVPEMRDFLGELQRGLERSGTDVELALLAVVPNDTGDTRSDQRSRERYEEMDAPLTPFEFRERAALLSDSMDDQRTALEWCEERDNRPRSHEEETLEKFRRLGEIILRGSASPNSDGHRAGAARQEVKE